MITNYMPECGWLLLNIPNQVNNHRNQDKEHMEAIMRRVGVE
jgi:hypothetical protein